MASRRATAAAALAGLMLVLAGCGSSITSSGSGSKSASSAAAPSTGTRRPDVLRTKPAPLPAGTPPAPVGLARTGGYETYELCRGRCSGRVPANLRRPLRLPTVSGTACPVSTGESPVSVSGGPSVTARRFIGSRWLAAQATWRAAANYRGPVLIRGRRIGGGGAVGFGEGREPYDELQLFNGGRDAPASGAGSRAWLSITRVRRPGCYAYQVDGTSFTRVIVFHVRAGGGAA